MLRRIVSQRRARFGAGILLQHGPRHRRRVPGADRRVEPAHRVGPIDRCDHRGRLCAGGGLGLGAHGHNVNTRGAFFAARVLAEAPELKIEDDHELIWMSPQDALLKLDRESHAWAMALWLRRFAQGPGTG